jgi:Zn-finger nucleic acid-binding protein
MYICVCPLCDAEMKVVSSIHVCPNINCAFLDRRRGHSMISEDKERRHNQIKTKFDPWATEMDWK